MELAIWNMVLSIVAGGTVMWVKSTNEELKRLSILISRTREEHSDKFVTKQDMHNDINRVLQRLDRMDEKLDAFMKEQRSVIN
jgi:hypothetical protein